MDRPPQQPLPRRDLPHRLGPRPLQLHLLAQASTLFSSRAALPSWKSGSFVWKPHLQSAAEQLRSQIDGVDAEVFARALTVEARRRIDGFLRGVEAYRRHPYQRDLPAPPAVWEEGTTRLIDYASAGTAGGPVLVVPSLVNRAYILDLATKRSFLRYLAAKGLRPFLVDWGAPGAAEKGFSLDDYVVGRLGRALDQVLRLGGRPVVLGYCMGGLLATGLAGLRQPDVKGLVTLATPWDFHAPTPLQGRLVAAMRQPLEDALAVHGEIPVDLLQALFAMVDPGAIERKFRAFSALNARSARARDFVALEDWVNDGVPLPGPTARQCLFGWYVDNQPAKGVWRLGGELVRPRAFEKPALTIVPAKDRIVPPQSALALADLLPHARRRIVDSGHIGMLTGARAKTEVYAYVAKWLSLVLRH